MKPKRKLRAQVRDEKQARQARRVINGIFLALILLMVLSLIGYYLLN